MTNQNINCPNCEATQQDFIEKLITDSGFKRCWKCKKVFEWMTDKTITYKTFNIAQIEEDK